ncbi:MAG: hypothetical protein J6D35_02060 [Chryseobacterium sp.]|nr:hypothetical protein [Chryseobacterium sp.]
MKKIALLAVCGLSFVSCATILTGTNTKIAFASEPSGAKVLYKGQEKCTTPCIATFNKSLSNVNVEYKLENYPTKNVNLNRNFNGTTILNVLLGGIIGIGIDVATGSVMNYTDNSYFVDFNKDSVAAKKVKKDEMNAPAATGTAASAASDTAVSAVSN